ncbi:phage shock protein C (PspC) family protein [Mucilaginibacter gracilis]|uniref:Phage shock protein C (PspC) family protein n=1 Tax=Mucilaginibacter gracilis TaxID=423350 RepID=A0A495J7X4_9SPHI|nr:PspC domain-containing protein [Mucilaginibacter gracilis]RKR85085.1 phage shock protein C (PspC) family protein [Mucilaginibacter gracilis]
MRNRLYRDEQHKTIGGVCAGLAAYFNVDVALVRVIFVLAMVLGGGGFLGYVILWVVVPSSPIMSPADEFFARAQPIEVKPFTPVSRQVTKGSIIGGVVLIMFGVYLTLDQLDVIPDIDFNTFWPIALIVVGLILMFGFWQKKPDSTTSGWDDNTLTKNTSTTTTDNSSII